MDPRTSPTSAERGTPRLSGLLLPAALVLFAVVAWTNFRDLPEQVPVHFTSTGDADRFATPKQFVGLSIMTAALLGAALLAARYHVSTEQVTSEHVYARFPHLRTRVALVLDVLGAGGLLLVTWVTYLCARAARIDDPSLPRLALTLPLGALLMSALAAAVWTRPVWREQTSGKR